MKRTADKSKITLAKVAQDAGVSAATASLILSNRNGWIQQFHPDTVRRVRASAEKLGYRRNLFATGLHSGEPPFFALVLTGMETELESWPHWAFQGALLEGVNAAAERNGIYTVVSTMHAHGGLGGLEKLAAIIDGGVLGAVFCTPVAEAEELIRDRLSRRQPAIVLFPRQVTAWPTNSIDVDNAAIGRVAGQLLAAEKCREWVLVRHEQMAEAYRLRCEGFAQVAREVGIGLTAIELPSPLDEDSAVRLLASHLGRIDADGVFAVDSTASMASVLGCLKAGLAPGSDCAIVGCDAPQRKIPGLPQVTSVGIPWRKAGVLAVERLLQAKGSKGRFKTLLLRPHIIEGDSCPVPRRFLSERPRSSRKSNHLPLAV